MTTAPKYNCVLLSICVFMILSMFIIITTKATPTYMASNCTNTSAPNTIVDDFFFRFSRRYHRFSLRSWRPRYSSHYWKTFTYKGTSSNSFEGLILCRGDVTATICDQCVTAAFKEIRIQCPNQAEALIWYDECFLCYTNTYFSIDKIDPRANLDDGNIDSSVDLGRFNQSLYGLLNRLVMEAATAKKFATGEAVVTEWRKVHGLMQCADDITNSECERCLRNAIGTLPNGKQGARALLPFCNVRYQLYPFFNLSSPPPLQSSGDRKLDRPDTNAVADLVAFVIVFIPCMLCLCCFSYLMKRSRKKKRLIPSLMEKCM
ncbi:cysteine-rich receptor-like protein kinase [Trifolium pratense]|uniref:Cysteine-rich receptor-like protein kinase n=1 Tax=Trifolium pratense TaxID=57577 RepID=A0A2K3LXT1_TRIPR|nr:cysteine-rich receptor-like protein kinase [Trifolium pratense]